MEGHSCLLPWDDICCMFFMEEETRQKSVNTQIRRLNCSRRGKTKSTGGAVHQKRTNDFFLNSKRIA